MIAKRTSRIETPGRRRNFGFWILDFGLVMRLSSCLFGSFEIQNLKSSRLLSSNLLSVRRELAAEGEINGLVGGDLWIELLLERRVGKDRDAGGAGGGGIDQRRRV